MTLIMTILSVFGNGLGTLFSWVVNYFTTKAQQAKNAVTSMFSDMDAHAGDGAISVGDKESAQAQIDDLKMQAQQMDSAPPVTSKDP